MGGFMKRTLREIFFDNATKLIRAISPAGDETYLNPGVGKELVTTLSDNLTLTESQFANYLSIRVTGTTDDVYEIRFPTGPLAAGLSFLRHITNESDQSVNLKLAAGSVDVTVLPKNGDPLTFGEAVDAVAGGSPTSAYPHSFWIRISSSGVEELPSYSEEAAP
jgi:hypothetical protein